MRTDFETIEFFWEKTMNDPEYSSSREYPGNMVIVKKWELKEGVKDLMEYRKRMKWIEALAVHFQPGRDYELTINEIMEILS